MAASERLSLLLETKTSGEQDVARLEQAINRVLSAAERTSGKSGNTDSLKSVFGDIKGAITDPLNTAAASAENFALKFGGLGVAVAAGAVGVGVAGKAILDFVSAQGEAAEGMLNLAARTGLTVGQVDKLSAMARIAGVNIDALEGSSKILATTLEDNSAAGDKAFRAMSKLGVSIYDTAGNQRELGAVTAELIERLAGVSSASERVALANSTLGKGAKEIQPLIAQYAELDQIVTALGFGTRDGLLKALAEADDKMDVLGLKWDLLKSKLAVPLTAVVNVLYDFAGPDRQRILNPEGSVRDALALSHGDPIRNQEAANRSRIDSFLSNLATQDRASSFRSALRATPEGRLKDLQDQISEVERQSKNGVPGAAAEYQRLTIAIKDAKTVIEAIQKEAALQKQLAEFVYKEQPNAFNPRTRGMAVPTLRRPVIQNWQQERFTVNELNGVGAFIASDADIAAANGGATQARMAQLRALVEGNAKAEQDRIDRQQQAQRAELDHRVRMIQLLAGPGGEVAAIQRIYELRIKGAQTELEKQEAINQREEAIAELRKRRVDDFADNVTRGFDALVSSGLSGLTSFGQSFFQGIERQIVGNIARLSYSSLGSVATLPGQGTAENPNFLGKLLQGTPFGLDSKDLLKTSTDANTAATIANTQALMARAGFSPGAASSILSGIPDLASGGSTGNPFIFGAARDNKLLEQVAAGRGLTNIDLGTGIPGVSSTNSSSRFASLYKSLGVAGAVAGGGYGIYRGVSEGGIQGALTATSSAAGMGAALLPLLGLSGPLAPILGFASLGFMGLKSLFGDPRQKRDRFISNTLDSARYEAPSSINYETDEYGRGIDYNKRGQVRPVIIINQQIDNLDAKSLIDRGPDIAEATRQAVERGHAAALTEMLQQQGKPY